MIFDAGSGAAREIVMVLALAAAGLLLAMAAAFTPWYGGSVRHQGPVVEMPAPNGGGSEAGAADGEVSDAEVSEVGVSEAGVSDGGQLTAHAD